MCATKGHRASVRRAVRRKPGPACVDLDPVADVGAVRGLRWPATSFFFSCSPPSAALPLARPPGGHALGTGSARDLCRYPPFLSERRDNPAAAVLSIACHRSSEPQSCPGSIRHRTLVLRWEREPGLCRFQTWDHDPLHRHFLHQESRSPHCATRCRSGCHRCSIRYNHIMEKIEYLWFGKYKHAKCPTQPWLMRIDKQCVFPLDPRQTTEVTLGLVQEAVMVRPARRCERR